MSYSALFVQPYSLWNDAITRYNGACAKVNFVFTARRYICISAVFAVGRCPSVRPSIRHVRVGLLYCIQTAEDIIKHFSRPGSPIILVFDPKRWYPIPGGPLHRGCKTHRAVCDFALKSPFISEAVGDRPVVATER